MAHRLLRRSSQTAAGSSEHAPVPAVAAEAAPSAHGGPDAHPAAYWRARVSCQCYTAQSGRPCGDVPVGAVVCEETCFVDVFDNVWIGCRANPSSSGAVVAPSAPVAAPPATAPVEESSGSVVWVSKYALGTHMSLDREQHWERVVTAPSGDTSPARERNFAAQSSSVPPAAASALTGSAPRPPAPRPVQDEYVIAPIDVEDAPLPHPAQTLIPDIVYIHQYWTAPVPAASKAAVAGGGAAALQRRVSKGGSLSEAAASPDRDWNHEYQSLIEEILYNPRSRSNEVIRQELHQLFSDFSDVAGDAALTIVEEMLLPTQGRKLPPASVTHPMSTGGGGGGGGGASSLGVYFHKGVMFKLCVDISTNLGGDDGAMKVASQALRAAGAVAQTAPKYLLHCPLTMGFTYRGYRILASTIPPVTADSLVYGSCDGGKTRRSLPKGSPGAHAAVSTASGPDRDECSVLSFLISKFAEDLSIKPHAVRPFRAPPAAHPGSGGPVPAAVDDANATSDGEMILLPVDTGVYVGDDQRWYILDVTRVLPPFAPVSSYHGYKTDVNGHYWRLRPELMSEVERQVSPDAFIPRSCSATDNHEIVILTQWIRDVGIPTVAAVLCFLEPTDATTEEFVCCGCNQKIDEQLAFNICEATDCCKVCPQCHLDTIRMYHWDGDEEAATRRVVGFVKCQRNARPVLGAVMVPTVTQIMHAHGVNMRYLGYVHAKLTESARPAVAHYLETEMVARAAKRLMNRGLRLAQDHEQVRTFVANFYSALLLSDGPLAETFWEEDLGPAVQQQFDVFEPFDTSRMEKELLYERVAEMTGVTLTSDSVASFAAAAAGAVDPAPPGRRAAEPAAVRAEPFVQLQRPHPVMKALRVPYLVDEPGDANTFFDPIRRDVVHAWQSRFGELAAYARGRGDSGAPSESVLRRMGAYPEAKRPFYLRASIGVTTSSS